MNGLTADVLATVRRQVERDPDRLLYSFLDAEGREANRLTRGEFFARVELLASHLAAIAGAQPGDRLLVAYPPGLEMICAFFACVAAGLTPVPVAGPTRLGLHLGLTRMDAIAQDCQPMAVLTTKAIANLLLDRPDAMAGRSAAFCALSWLTTDVLRAPIGRAGICRRAGEILFLQYTSGSTRQPKGVIVSHQNILANARLTIDHSDAIGVSWLPQHHDMGLIGYYINSAVAGATLYGFPPEVFVQRPALWLETISKRRATATSAPNFALEYCLRRVQLSREAAADLDLSSLKFLMAAAEPVKPDTYRRFLHAFTSFGLRPEALVVAYGLAENTLAVSSYGRRSLSLKRAALTQGFARVSRRVSDVSDARHLMSCGVPLGDNQVLIVDPTRRQPRSERVVGEIWVSGPSKCLGYWNDPAASAETFNAELDGAVAPAARGRYLRTGDLGFLHDGELYVCGRLKDLIIIRGQNYYPQDIEFAVDERCGGVRRGGVAAFEGEHENRAIVVVLVEAASVRSPPDLAAVAEAVRHDTGVTPDEVVLAPPRSIPKTSSGKVRRNLAREMLADGRIVVLARLMTHSDRIDGTKGTIDPFAAVRERYGLTGEETHSLADAGVNSLDQVLVLHELVELLSKAGGDDLADQVDMRVVQERSVAELFGFGRRLKADPIPALAQLRRVIASEPQPAVAADRANMCDDLQLQSPAILTANLASARTDNVLLTGATGFLGPFLLTNLLEQGDGRIYALVRAATDEQARARLRADLAVVGSRSPDFWRAFDHRVVPLAGDLERPRLGLAEPLWTHLAKEVGAIHHNGACVNYLMTYRRMRAANVLGTLEALRLATESAPKAFNHISTTFIFGWAAKSVLVETDENAGMELLDFGYSQSKWVAEQQVLTACRQGLPVRIFRPALIAPSLEGKAVSCDISLRLLAFMIKHGIGVDAANQLSLLPVDVVAANIVAIARHEETLGQTFHMTRRAHSTVADTLDAVTRLTGRTFHLYDLKAFVPEVIHRCTRDDPLFPLLDFLVGSIKNISLMAFKRYDNSNYRRACETSSGAQPEPSLDATTAGVVRFLKDAGLVEIS